MTLTTRYRRLLETMGSRGSFTRLVLITAIIVITFAVISPRVFLSASNLQFLAVSVPELALLSMAVAVAMLTGGIDLSIVAVANMSGIVAAIVMRDGDGSATSMLLGALAGLAAAVLCGAMNGAIIALFRVTPILATLGTSQLIAGLSLVLSDGSVITGLPAGFGAIAASTLAGVPVVFLIMVLIAVIMVVVLTRTPLGVRMRLMGANPTAAEFSGIRVTRITLTTYMIAGALSGIAGLIITARASGANSDYGASYLLLAIVVAVLAGVNPDGGYITIAGVVIAALALQILSTGLLGAQVSSHIVNIAQGLLLILMMALNHYSGTLRSWINLRAQGAAAR